MGSLLEDLRAMAQAVAAKEHKDITVMGSGGRIAVRYRSPDRDVLDQVLTAVAMGRALTSDEEQQLLVDCCDSVMSVNDTGDAVPYDDEGALRFDASDPRWEQVAKVIAEINHGPVVIAGRKILAPDTARECVQVLFRLDKQPLAANGHANALLLWLQGLDAEIAARVEGKSVAESAADEDAA